MRWFALLTLLHSSMAAAAGGGDIVPVQANETSQAEFSRAFSYPVATDTAEAGTTASVIIATAHAARVGDLLRFTTAGANYLVESHVASTTANSITLTRAIPAAPSVGNAFQILRLISPALDSAGALTITGSISATNPSVGTNGAAAPASSTQVGFLVGANLQPVSVANPLPVSAAVSFSTTATGSNQKYGKLTCSALTGAFATVVQTGFLTCVVQVFNSCNDTIILSLDGGVTSWTELEAFEGTSLDFCANGRNVATTVNLQAKHAGVVPTAGTIRISTAG